MLLRMGYSLMAQIFRWLTGPGSLISNTMQAGRHRQISEIADDHKRADGDRADGARPNEQEK